MNLCVAVFRSRTQVFSFIEAMQSYGAVANAVNTPKEAHVGCGISAKFSEKDLSLARKIVYKGRFDSFYGFFIIEKRASRTTTTRI